MLSLPDLHAGERAGISLAHEHKQSLLLIDERAGREVAQSLGIAVAGTIGLLEKAAVAELLDLEAAFDDLKKTDFWVSAALLDRVLDRFRQR